MDQQKRPSCNSERESKLDFFLLRDIIVCCKYFTKCFITPHTFFRSGADKNSLIQIFYFMRKSYYCFYSNFPNTFTLRHCVNAFYMFCCLQVSNKSEEMHSFRIPMLLKAVLAHNENTFISFNSISVEFLLL